VELGQGLRPAVAMSVRGSYRLGIPMFLMRAVGLGLGWLQFAEATTIGSAVLGAGATSHCRLDDFCVFDGMPSKRALKIDQVAAFLERGLRQVRSYRRRQVESAGAERRRAERRT